MLHVVGGEKGEATNKGEENSWQVIKLELVSGSKTGGWILI